MKIYNEPIKIDINDDKIGPRSTDHYKIVHDAEKGRFEVPAGIGDIQVCVAHKIETNDRGGKTYVPVFSTMRF